MSSLDPLEVNRALQPFHRLDLDSCDNGNPRPINNWRSSAVAWWDRLYAKDCHPLHLRSIPFLWTKDPAQGPEEPPIYCHINTMEAFNNRAKRKKFPEYMKLNNSHHMNDCILAHVVIGAVNHIKLCDATSGAPPKVFDPPPRRESNLISRPRTYRE